MKKLIAIFAIIGIFLQTFSQFAIVAAYYANKGYIAKNLCENRDKPKMHCDGKCCLKKKLAKEGSEKAPSQNNQKSEQLVNLFYDDTRFEMVHATLSSIAPTYISYNNLQTSSYHSSVFHPPGA